MTSTHPAQAQAVRIESYLSILIARRNMRAHRQETRYSILRAIGALRLVRCVGGSL